MLRTEEEINKEIERLKKALKENKTYFNRSHNTVQFETAISTLEWVKGRRKIF